MKKMTLNVLFCDHEIHFNLLSNDHIKESMTTIKHLNVK